MPPGSGKKPTQDHATRPDEDGHGAKLDLDHFRHLLKARHDELTGLLALGAEATEPVKLDQSSVGRLSRMDAMERQAMAQETARRRAQELQRIEAALRRMDDGEYGFCIKTGEPIPRARLELDPAAATIVVKK